MESSRSFSALASVYRSIISAEILTSQSDSILKTTSYQDNIPENQTRWGLKTNIHFIFTYIVETLKIQLLIAIFVTADKYLL